MVRRAVDAGEKEVLVMRFPSEWLPDQGGPLPAMIQPGAKD